MIPETCDSRANEQLDQAGLAAGTVPGPCDSRTDGRGKERVRHGTALFPVAFYDTDLRQYPVSWHWHTELEAVVVTQGAAVFAVGQERFTVRQGEGIFINSGVLHAVWNADESAGAQEGSPQGGILPGGVQGSALPGGTPGGSLRGSSLQGSGLQTGVSLGRDLQGSILPDSGPQNGISLGSGPQSSSVQGCRLRSAVFHARLVAGGFDSVFWQEYLQPLTSDSARQSVLLRGGEPWHAQALCAVETAWKSYARHLPGYEFEVREALSRLTLLLCRHRAPAQANSPERVLREEERLKQMLRFIEEHYASELTAAQIAQSARISESECLRCFRRTIGTPPSQYLKQFRVQKAAQLLAATGQGIAEIGALCGFQDASYFTKTFREMKGCTPSEFRRMNRESGGNGQPVHVAAQGAAR